MLDNPVLDKLVVDLARAYQTFSQQQADDDNPRQAGAIEAIDSLLNFLRAAGVRRELYTPLLAVLAGLSDASEGRSNDILRKAQYQKGTSKKPIFETLNLEGSGSSDDLQGRRQMAVGQGSVDSLEGDRNRPKATHRISQKYWEGQGVSYCNRKLRLLSKHGPLLQGTFGRGASAVCPRSPA